MLPPGESLNIHPIGVVFTWPIFENVTSSTKRQVYNLPSEDRATARENIHTNLVKFDHPVFEIREQKDRHIRYVDRSAAHS